MTTLDITQPEVVVLEPQAPVELTVTQPQPIELVMNNGTELVVDPPQDVTLELIPYELVVSPASTVELTIGASFGGGGGGVEQGTPYDDESYLYVVTGVDESWASQRTNRITFLIEYTGTQSGTKPTDLATVQGLSYS